GRARLRVVCVNTTLTRSAHSHPCPDVLPPLIPPPPLRSPARRSTESGPVPAGAPVRPDAVPARWCGVRSPLALGTTAGNIAPICWKEQSVLSLEPMGVPGGGGG